MASYIFPQYENLLARVRSERIMMWAAIENDFLAVTSEFDTKFVAGEMAKGDYKAKARYFNDLVAAIVTNRTGQHIGSRGKRAGAAFAQHDVDLVYPDPMGLSAVRKLNCKPLLCGETKIAGTPPYPGNKGTSGEDGRPVKQDLDKRAREMVTTAIDLKRRWSEGPIVLEETGLRASDPKYGIFYACRIATESDRTTIVERLTQIARLYVDGVGMFFYACDQTSPTAYHKAADVPGFSIDDVITLFQNSILAETVQ